MRVLLIEDERTLAQSIELMLRSESIQLATTELGEEGLRLALDREHDIILLDLNLPDISGYDVLRSLRATRVKTPVLILSGLDAIANKVKGLGFGSDDYLTKPFHKDELVARIHAIVRRSAEHVEAVVHCGDLAVRTNAKKAEIAGKPVYLTTKEYGILELLASRPGGTFTKEMFLSAIYCEWTSPK
jgi:two-component system, cell cycle response regulator CtrA